MPSDAQQSLMPDMPWNSFFHDNECLSENITKLPSQVLHLTAKKDKYQNVHYFHRKV